MNQSKSARLLCTTMSTSNRPIEKYGFATRYSPELFNVSEENKFHKSEHFISIKTLGKV